MVSYIYQNILNSPDRPKRSADARSWFRDQAQNVRRGQVSPQQMITGNRSDLTNTLLPGRMYMWIYDPKYKNELPYYDTFPLVIILEKDRDSILGLNLHYLPPELRARLMDGLYERTVNLDANNLQTRIRVTYTYLRSVAKLRMYRPCIKRYLFSHIKSRMLYVNPDKWDVALMLPTARFKKASINRVYRESRMKSRRR